jgi:surface antigen
MSQTPQEMTKEIIIAAMQNGYISKSVGGTIENMEKSNVFNADEIAKAYKKVFKAIVNAND